MATTKEKIWLAVAAFAIGGAFAAFAKGKNSDSDSDSNSETNMNKGQTDAKSNRDGVTPAVWNQNPLNVKVRIRNKKITRIYPGDISTDGTEHIMFDNWTNGAAGAMIHLWRYLNGDVAGNVYEAGTRLNTIERIINTWAPKSDPKNDTEGYIRFVERETNINRRTTLSFKRDTILLLVKVMSMMEDRTATTQVTPSVLSEAWDVATKYLQAQNRL